MRPEGEKVLGFRRVVIRLGLVEGEGNAAVRRAAQEFHRQVLNTERSKGVTIIRRRGPKGGWGGVTMSDLRRHMPWVFKAGAREQNALEQKFREYLENLEERFDESAERAVTKLVEPQLDEMHGENAQLSRRMDAVEKELAAARRARGVLPKTSSANDVKRRETPSP